MEEVPPSVFQSNVGVGNSSCKAHLDLLKNQLKGTACPFCTKVFDTNILKMVHLLYNHYSTFTKQACKKCGEIVDDMAEHLAVTHKLTKLHCPTCFLSYASEPSLVRHFNKLHILKDEPPPQVQCPGCPKVFTKFANMTSHFNQKHTPNPTRYFCGYCPMTFSQRSSRINHIDRVHMKRHKRCKLCKKLYINKVTHIRLHHPELPVDTPEEDFKDPSFNPLTRACQIYPVTPTQPRLPPSIEIVLPPVSIPHLVPT